MNYSTKAALGIKDPYLELDTAHFKDAIEDQGNQVIVHLIQSYPLHCPRCGQLMLKNGFKLVKVLGPSLHYEPTIWSIRKQTSVNLPMIAPRQLPNSLQLGISITVIILLERLSNGQ